MSEKGHFAVYSADKKRFLLPLEYLKNEIIKQLFNMAEEEFGLQNKGPLTLPCDTEHMGYAFGLIKQQATRDVENAFLTSISSHYLNLFFQHGTRSMISPKKLIKIARKWQRRTAMRRNRISFPKISTNRNAKSSNTSTSTTTGNFVICTRDQKRLTVPLAYLNNNIMKELLKMSEEVYGLSSEGPIKLPFDAVFMEYVVSIIKKGLVKDIEKALLMSMEASCCSTSICLHQGHTSQQLLILLIEVVQFCN
ncbi:auxin-responsive protein SAUR66-like [Hevea brasiliensis]|nr:auxin-responsive protein SAUR66-like [Hevea brasiliensis]